MHRPALTLILLTLILAMTTACSSKKSGEVLVTVGSVSITEPDLELLAKVNPRLKRRLMTPNGKRQVLENYVEQELMSQEAKSRGLDSEELVQAKIALYRKVILAQSLLEETLEEESLKYFNDNPGEFEKVRIAHVYVPFKTANNEKALGKKAKVTRTDAQAKKRIQKAREETKKTGFEKVAAKYSADSRNKDSGGEIGWVSVGDARLGRWGWDPLVVASMSMKAGELSEPIKTDSGYHLVKVLEPAKMDDYEQVKSRIRFKIQAQVKGNLVNSLQEKYDVEFVEVAPVVNAIPAVDPGMKAQENTQP